MADEHAACLPYVIGVLKTRPRQISGIILDSSEWICSFEYGITSPPIEAGGKLYVRISGGNLYSVSIESGRKELVYSGISVVTPAPVISSDGILYLIAGGKIVAMSTASGKIIWSKSQTSHSGYSITIASNTLYVGTLSSSGSLLAIDCRTGKTKWTFSRKSLGTSEPAIGPDGTVYLIFTNGESGELCALDGELGHMRWSVKGKFGAVSAVVDSIGTVYSLQDSRVFAYDGDSGKEKWSVDKALASRGSLSIGGDGSVYYGGIDGTVTAIK